LTNKLLVTGGTGFIGEAVLRRVNALGMAVIAVTRSSSSRLPGAVPVISKGDLTPETDWSDVLKGVSVVIHTAARAHVTREATVEQFKEIHRVNVEGTLNLAQQAVEAGVRRFIFVSSIKVNGEQTIDGAAFKVEDPPSPKDPYGISKWEAEQRLMALAKESGMEVVVIRPPLVYGPGVKANFLSMMCWLYKGVPLPFGAIQNRRSLVALDNLVDLIMICIEHPAAANQIFLVSDGEDLSTTELLQRTASAMGKKALLLPIPQCLLEFGLNITGKKALAQRLCGSLQVDISKTQEVLGWSPPVSVDEELHKTVTAFINELP